MQKIKKIFLCIVVFFFLIIENLQPKNHKSILIYAATVEDVLSIQSLSIELQKRYPDYDILLATNSFEGQKAASYFLPIHMIKIVINNDLNLFLYLFQFFNPKLLIFIRTHNPMVLFLLAQFFKVPCFLMQAKAGVELEEDFFGNRLFYQLLYSTFHGIFTETQDDSLEFNNLVTEATKITPIGSIYLSNIFVRQEHYLQSMNTNREKIENYFGFPLVLVQTYNKEKMDFYINLFLKLKRKFPNFKLVWVVGHALTWKGSLFNRLTEKGIPFFVWEKGKLGNEIDAFFDYTTQRLSLLEKIEKMLTDKDIIICSTDGTMFFWHSITKIFVTDKSIILKERHNLMEAASWKNAMIINHMYEWFEPKFIREAEKQYSFLLHAKKLDELESLITDLLENSAQQKERGEQAYAWLLRAIDEHTLLSRVFYQHLDTVLNSGVSYGSNNDF